MQVHIDFTNLENHELIIDGEKFISRAHIDSSIPSWLMGARFLKIDFVYSHDRYNSFVYRLGMKPLTIKVDRYVAETEIVRINTFINTPKADFFELYYFSIDSNNHAKKLMKNFCGSLSEGPPTNNIAPLERRDLFSIKPNEKFLWSTYTYRFFYFDKNLFNFYKHRSKT